MVRLSVKSSVALRYLRVVNIQLRISLLNGVLHSSDCSLCGESKRISLSWLIYSHGKLGPYDFSYADVSFIALGVPLEKRLARNLINAFTRTTLLILTGYRLVRAADWILHKNWQHVSRCAILWIDDYSCFFFIISLNGCVSLFLSKQLRHSRVYIVWSVSLW